MEETLYGQCRCCLTEGQHRDVMQEYYLNGTKEVYHDIFVACFNLYLSHSTSHRLICMSCIQHLRDASTFRAKVLNSEQQLLKACNNETLISASPLEQPECAEVKIEIVVDDVKQELYSEEDNSPLVNDKDTLSEWERDERMLLSRFPAGSLPPLPTRRSLYTTCRAYVSHLDYLRGKDIPAKKILESTEMSSLTILTSNKVCMTDKMAHVTNVCTLLENSNITPFKSKSRAGFSCYYCSKMCENLQSLREHQSTEQNKANIKRILKKYGVECFVIYVDVTDLKCTICSTSLDSLNKLKDHLSKLHDKKWYGNVEDRVIPFKLGGVNNFECQVCKFNFETFGTIERHMNVHYRNYVCDECATGFVTKQRLKVHIRTVHKEGVYPCEKCKKMFNTPQKYKTHVDSVHKMIKKNKCLKCPARFAEYFQRQKHMAEVHGLAPVVYKCNVCEKAYNRKYHLSCHMKRCHLDERQIQCQFCAYSCCTNSELRSHLVKHDSARAFECGVCKKTYARKKTLREHMRIHNNDRRFACSVCGQAFVQNSSLKGHIKTHHPECVS